MGRADMRRLAAIESTRQVSSLPTAGGNWTLTARVRVAGDPRLISSRGPVPGPPRGACAEWRRSGCGPACRTGFVASCDVRNRRAVSSRRCGSASLALRRRPHAGCRPHAGGSPHCAARTSHGGFAPTRLGRGDVQLGRVGGALSFVSGHVVVGWVMAGG
jgi:hypothetical protein